MPIDQDPMFSTTKTALPYRSADDTPTTGGSGSSASHDRAAREAADGTAARRQARILALLAEAGPMGLTVAEVREQTGQHHGQASGALSSMHKDGLIRALKLDRRGGCSVYVLPVNVLGRIVRPFRSQATEKEVAVPVEVARPRLTSEERQIIDKVRALVDGDGDGIVRLRPSTARTLLKALKRLDA